MAKSVEEAMATLFRNLETQTGKPITEWVATARGLGLAKHGQIMAILKQEHGLSHAHANQIALRALKADDPSPGVSSVDPQLDAQYAGSRSAVRPIYEALIRAVSGFGPDVEIAPKKNNVSLRRSKQFALIQPSTATRVDVGLILKDFPDGERLEASGSFNAMFTHRVRVASVSEVDSELVGWLRQAYQSA